MRHPSVRGAAWLLVLLGLTSCGGSESGTGPETPQATSITISPNTVSLSFIGGTANLTATIKDQNGGTFAGTVTWSSDDPSVSSVSSGGVVTAVSNGTGTVRAVFGSLATTVAVTVRQIAVSLSTVSGDTQSAFAGSALADPVVVRALDQGGSAVQATTVTFAPTEGDGSVSAGAVETDANGDASTTWTLGEALGAQQLTASVTDGATTIVTATSLSLTPLPDITTGGTIVVTRADPSSLETVEVQVTIRNDGDASTGGGFRAQLLADGMEIATSDVPVIAASAFQTVTFTVGPFAAGLRRLRFNADADDVIEESDEANNGVDRNVQVLLQTEVSAGTPVTGLSGIKDDEMLFRIDLPAGSQSNLTVELSGGTGDVDLFIERGDRPSFRAQYDDCLSGSPTTTERCQISPVTPGAYHILLHAFSTYSGTTMTITLDGEVLPYDIEVVFIDHGTEAQDAAVIQAAERWMSIITTDITDSDFSSDPYEADTCITGQPLVDDTVDDLRIYVSIVEIDGPSGVLARAGPCVTRGLTNFPIIGSMTLDAADLARLEDNGDMLPVVLHEMGHILGIGSIWTDGGFLRNRSLPSSSGADTHFTGPLAIAAFDAAGGSDYTGGAKVPVANLADEGSSDAHWRESVLDNELMTPLFDSGIDNPLSAISLQSLADLGYTIDINQADSYSKAFSSPARSVTTPRPVLDLGDDVRRGPVVVVDQKGRIIIIRE